MDILCLNCLGPWGMCEIVEAKESNDEEFEINKNGVPTSCPSCHGRNLALSPARKKQREIVLLASQMFGDDIDGLAVELSDCDLL